MGTEVSHASLPTELWYPIIYMLPSLDQKTCLSVSKIFHDIAATSVFSHVTISLGFWRPFEFESEYDDLATEEKAAMKRQANTSYDVLRHIMRTPDFAKKVKKLSVRAFANAGEEMQIAIRFLADALEALPDLRAFVWHGSSPVISTEILQALVSFASSTLQELSIPPELPEGSDTLLPLLNHVRSFSIMDRDFVPDEKECPVIRAAINANADPLRSVCLTGDIWAQLPPLSRFAHLDELEFICLETYDELGTLFAHCSRLRAFALVYAEQDLIPVLAAYPHALPNLDSFKLWGIDYTGDDVAVLAEFLRPKRRLRRLDVMVRVDTPGWVTNDARVCPVLLPLLEIMPALPDLHVVGLSFRVREVQEVHIRDLQAYLPRNLTALLVWTDVTSTPIPAKHWTDLFAAYKSLRYLHIVPDYYDVLELQEHIFQDPPPNIELFGYGAQIHPMRRESTIGPAVLYPRWPYPKVYFRTADDYGDEDWEWLLRHHGYDEDEHFMHNADAFR
ncbi:hypothetical protein LXA43DRAFT_495097 [Ganoderma leucocontextum]|nr:hypothetical protein LXA43DRAFT_495097 [Ganoderma leucocontextum]